MFSDWCFHQLVAANCLSVVALHARLPMGQF